MAGVRENNSFSYALRNFFILFFVFLFCFSLFIEDDSNSSGAEADGFWIDSYDVVLDVHENNIVDVVEKITVNWYEGDHHGIYRFIPSWLEYTGKDGKTIKRKSVISNLSSTDPYIVSTVNKKKQIKIGDANVFVPVGLYTYTIEYSYDMGQDPFDGFDEFIFHFFGDYWGTSIKNASFQVNMPFAFEKENVTFFGDKYRTKDVSHNLYYYVEENILYAEFWDGYAINNALTLDIELPEGYFIGGNNHYGYISLILSLGILFVFVLVLIRWMKYGKDHDKVPQTVEFYSPENYDAAQIGYIYGKQTSKKLTIALIVQLASKGYIKIDESKETKEITITNLVPKVSFSKLKDKELRTIKVSKLKEIDNTLSSADKLWMKHLFKKGNTKEILSGFDKFYKKSDYLIKNRYIEIESDVVTKGSDALMEQTTEIMKDYKHSLVSLTENEQIVYDNLFKTTNENVLANDKHFFLTFAKIANKLEKQLKKKVNDEKSSKKKKRSYIWLVVAIILWYISYIVIEDLNPIYSWIYDLAFVSIFVSTFLIILMDRKTPYGEKITSRVLGFRDYIKTVEKSQLESLVLTNPMYFYDILPYAYVLNVSKKWIEKFENIPLPVDTSERMGNFHYSQVDSLNLLANSVSFPSSSGSSSSGGCSSCGGGCASCGGGGSW